MPSFGFYAHSGLGSRVIKYKQKNTPAARGVSHLEPLQLLLPSSFQHVESTSEKINISVMNRK